MSFCGLPATRPPSSVLCRSDGPKREYEGRAPRVRSEEHTSELQSQSNLVCRLLLEKKNKQADYRDVVPSNLHPLTLVLRSRHATHGQGLRRSRHTVSHPPDLPRYRAHDFTPDLLWV